MNQPPFYMIANGDVRVVTASLAADSVDVAITSPPYWNQRDYGLPAVEWWDGWKGTLGSELTPRDYVAHLVQAFHDLRRLMKPTATFWLNVGDVFDDGNLLGIPWLVARAMVSDGWQLRSEIIWQKLSPMPGNGRRRPVVSHEPVFLFSKSPDYYYDFFALTTPGKWDEGTRTHARNVWPLANDNKKFKHFAPFPVELVRRCLMAGGPIFGVCTVCDRPFTRHVEATKRPTRPARDNKAAGQSVAVGGKRDHERHVTTYKELGIVATCQCMKAPKPAVAFDPFAGSGTVAAVAEELGMSAIACELGAQFVPIIQSRLKHTPAVLTF